MTVEHEHVVQLDEESKVCSVMSQKQWNWHPSHPLFIAQLVVFMSYDVAWNYFMEIRADFKKFALNLPGISRKHANWLPSVVSVFAWRKRSPPSLFLSTADLFSETISPFEGSFPSCKMEFRAPRCEATVQQHPWGGGKGETQAISGNWWKGKEASRVFSLPVS